ncbi:unnamed protein product [Discosporangium mesarthrocarpum]
MDLAVELAEAKNLFDVAKGQRVKEALSVLVDTLSKEVASAKPEPNDGPSKPEEETVIPAAEEGEDVDGAAQEKEGLGAPGTAQGAATGVGPGQGGAMTGVAAPVASVVPEGGEAAIRFEPITKYAWDQGGYNSPWVTLYVSLDGVGSFKEGVSCTFSKSGFDLRATGPGGKSHRLLQNNLEKDIVPRESTYTVKKNKVVVKLKKVKGEYGSYDTWSTLVAKKQRKPEGTAKDPTAGIMDMMKNMYDEGDDNMKKIIGEAMLKSHRGEKSETPSYEPPNFDDNDTFGSMAGSFGSGKKGGKMGGKMDIDDDDHFGLGDNGFGMGKDQLGSLGEEELGGPDIGESDITSLDN